mgnify:CR=1 FL=1
MALQGKFTWKGVDIDDAYIVISSVNAACNYETVPNVKTEAEYNEDGTVKTEAVIEYVQNKVLVGSYVAYVYKDKATKDANPNSIIVDSIYGDYVPKHTASAKNDVAQAYVALKATDACKDLADA